MRAKKTLWFIKTPIVYSLRSKDLQNNRVLTYEGCFGFHQALNAKESRLYERLQHPWRVTCSQQLLKRSQYLLLGGLWVGT